MRRVRFSTTRILPPGHERRLPVRPAVTATNSPAKNGLRSGLDYSGKTLPAQASAGSCKPTLSLLSRQSRRPAAVQPVRLCPNNPLRHIDPTGMLIDDSQLSDKDKKKWQTVQNIAIRKTPMGTICTRNFRKSTSSLQSDSRTFVLENSKLGAGTAGVFTITNMTADGKDFTKSHFAARLQTNTGNFKRNRGRPRSGLQ